MKLRPTEEIECLFWIDRGLGIPGHSRCVPFRTIKHLYSDPKLILLPNVNYVTTIPSTKWYICTVSYLQRDLRCKDYPCRPILSTWTRKIFSCCIVSTGSFVLLGTFDDLHPARNYMYMTSLVSCRHSDSDDNNPPRGQLSPGELHVSITLQLRAQY